MWANVYLDVYDSNFIQRFNWVIGDTSFLIQPSSNGQFNFSIKMSQDAEVGNISFVVRFNGYFTYTPTFDYFDNNYAMGSNYLNATVNATTQLTAIRDPPTSNFYGEEMWINGTLRLDNSTYLSFQSITIEILDSEYNVLNTTIVITDGNTLGHNYSQKYTITWPIAYVRVTYGGNSTYNLNPTTILI
jgi:hypothetical protein